MIRVGFVFSFDDGWLGGINYFRNLLAAIYALPDRKIEAVIFTGLKTPEKYFADFPPVTIMRSRLFDRGSLPWLVRRAWQRAFLHDPFLERLLRKYGIAVLSHSGWIGRGARIPTIGWIPDFQHLRLPEFFDAKEMTVRNRCYGDACRYCSTVIVSSFDALADLRRFDPDCQLKAKVLRFVVATTKARTSLPSRAELESKYQFTGKYFLLPNQFWKHKNHGVVIEALGLLVGRGVKVRVLSTGNTKDYRHPKYFEALMARAKDLGVSEYFVPLGLISTEDLAALMVHSSAIINPSLFEGWSTTVEEAKSLGKPVVLSDIPVHREQNPPLAHYFQPDDAPALAAILWDIWNTPVVDEEQAIQLAQQETNARRLEFAIQYQNIVRDTLGQHHR
ncbi:MAG: glycosyltransferase family 4 protein [Pseudomonadota bacterium]